ncbi:4-hydroxythreonine-4-phosphate dehydrogenase PdxA [Alphaproteobacteria bacterium 46_93_T64]|nr:4-hydroxythreonine-4-phosphate dehydrogenase PdxA [Alphaproteobacteria bacterium 46_93_T64]
MEQMSQEALVLTMGDPAGIGIEIATKAWIARKSEQISPFVLVGDASLIEFQVGKLFSDVAIEIVTSVKQGIECFEGSLPVMDPHQGQTDSEKTLAAIELATNLCQIGAATAMVTNPIQKKRLYDAGFSHPGHTEYLADLTGAPGKAIMMFACPGLKVVPATIHIPLEKVPESISEEQLEYIIRTTIKDLKSRFGKEDPRIVVAGLNPHAGEEGSIGRQELEIIGPLVERLSSEGLHVTGPYPSDSLFHAAARQKYDAAICMYHDQALIPIKTIDFDRGVNVTLGLPIIRTSPDHGTAEDIAGKGIANPASLIAAINMANEMAIRLKETS